VTHPSAANIREQAPFNPLDLHVLGTPPAFVLSQDQTLHNREIRIARVSCWHHLRCQFESEDSFVPFTDGVGSRTLFVDVLLFSFQGSLSIAFSRRLLYHNTLSLSSQQLFSICF